MLSSDVFVRLTNQFSVFMSHDIACLCTRHICGRIDAENYLECGLFACASS